MVRDFQEFFLYHPCCGANHANEVVSHYCLSVRFPSWWNLATLDGQLTYLLIHLSPSAFQVGAIALVCESLVLGINGRNTIQQNHRGCYTQAEFQGWKKCMQVQVEHRHTFPSHSQPSCSPVCGVILCHVIQVVHNRYSLVTSCRFLKK